MPKATHDQLRWVFDRTSGKCHICHRLLRFESYGKINTEGAWEIDHSVPRAKGGSDHLNNLFAACISCNRSKQQLSSRAARRRAGKKRSPLNREQRKKAVAENVVLGGTIGSIVLPALLQGLNPLAGLLLGAAAGASRDPDD
jgi:5-methylcytosine-specific restriction endonuclease McrA